MLDDRNCVAGDLKLLYCITTRAGLPKSFIIDIFEEDVLCTSGEKRGGGGGGQAGLHVLLALYLYLKCY